MKEEIKKVIENWVVINYGVIPKEIFDKYGCSPFRIMKRKMRDKNGKVWNNINYFDAKKECEKLCYRLPTIQEMLVLLRWYREQNREISYYNKEFLGVEELSYGKNVCCEWVEMNEYLAHLHGGCCVLGANAGAFSLRLFGAPSTVNTSLGFRCCQ